MKDFSHLHVHTDKSILDGINRIDQLISHTKKTGMSSIAITDHGTLYGLIDFYKEAVKEGIKPIIGVEAYITQDEDGIKENKNKTRDNHHCILLAQNEVGLRNIIWLTNQANLHNFYYRPRISLKNIKGERSKGIVATSSCLGGIISKVGEYTAASKIFEDPDKNCQKIIEKYQEVFDGKFYLELQDNPEFWQQEVYNKWLVDKSSQMDIPMVITSDAHFLTKKDKATHNMIMAHQMKCTLEEYVGDEDGMYYGDGHYIRTPEEMYQAAIKYNAESAFWNTTEIAKSCNLSIELGKVKMPQFDIENEPDYEEFKSWQSNKNECCNTHE